MMSTIRSVTDEDGDPPAPPPPPRLPLPPRTTEVTGPAHVEARIELQLSQCRRRALGLAVLCVNVDAVIGAHGAVGPHLESRVREEVSHRIGNAVRGSDAILRESDRDACVLMPGADAAAAERVARRLARLLVGDYMVAGELLRVQVRIGCAFHPRDGGRAPELLRRAGRRD